MREYEIEIDFETGRGSIRECPDYSDIDLPIFDKVSNIIFYAAGLIALVAMLITMIVSKIPFWILVAFLALAYIAAPILFILPNLYDTLPYRFGCKFRKFKKLKPFKIVLNMLLIAYFVLVCLEVYLLKTVGGSFGTISILVVCMYGIYFMPFLFYRAAAVSKSLFTCIYSWCAGIASVVLFIVGEANQLMGNFGPILLPFFLSVFYMLHTIIKLILKKKKKYGNNPYYEKVAPIICYSVLSLIGVGILGFAIWAGIATSL